MTEGEFWFLHDWSQGRRPRETALWRMQPFAYSGLPTIVHLLFTVHEVPADACRIFLGSQGSFDALNEVAEVV